MNILLIEDNPGYNRLITEAFREMAYEYSLSVATDGIMATSFLNKTDTYLHEEVESTPGKGSLFTVKFPPNKKSAGNPANKEK